MATTIVAAIPLLLLLVALARIGVFVPFAAVGFLVLLGLALGDVRVGLLASVIVTPLIPAPLSFRLGPFAFGASRLLGFALIVGWIAALSRPRGPLIRRTAVDPGLWFLLFAYLLSLAVNSAHISEALFGESLQRVLIIGVDYFLYFIAVVSILAADRRLIHTTLRVLSLTIFATALVGLFERVSGENIFSVLGPLYPPGFRSYVDTLAAASSDTRGGFERVQSTFVGPNQFGAALVMGLPVMLHLSAVALTRRGSRFWIAAAGSCVLASLFTASRSVVVGMALVVMIYGVSTARLRVTKVRLAALVLVMGLGLAVNPTVRATFQVYFSGLVGFQERSVQGRLADYEHVFRQLERTPIAGSGPSTWSAGVPEEIVGDRSGEPAAIVLDNSYLVLLAELGIVGLLALSGLLWGAVAVGMRGLRRTRDSEARSLRAAMLAVVTWFAVANVMFDELAFFENSRMYFTLLAVMVVASGSYRSLRPPGLTLRWLPGSASRRARSSTVGPSTEEGVTP